MCKRWILKARLAVHKTGARECLERGRSVAARPMEASTMKTCKRKCNPRSRGKLSLVTAINYANLGRRLYTLR